MIDTTPCYESNCKHLGCCKVLWGDACKVLGGKKIPRISTTGASNTFNAWERAEQDEQARQQAVRDQLRADGNEVRRRPMWLTGLAKVVGR